MVPAAEVPPALAAWSVPLDDVRSWTRHAGERSGVWSELPTTMNELLSVGARSREGVASWLASAKALDLVEEGPGGVHHPLWKGDPRAPMEEDPLELDTELVKDAFRRPAPHHVPARAWTVRGDPRLHRGFHTYLPAQDDAVDEVLQGAPRVLEVGAGDGGWLREVAPLLPDARFTAHEPQAAARQMLRRRLEGPGLGLRVHLRKERAESMTHAGGFDLVHLGQVLLQVPSVVTVLGRAQHALDRGGVLVVSGFLSDDAAPPEDVGNRDVGARRFLRRALGEATLSKQHLWRLMVEAGFQRIRFHPLEEPGAWFGVAEV